MAISIKPNLDGVTAAFQINGVDAITFGTSGIITGGNSINPGFFYKVDPDSAAFAKTGAGTAQIKAGTVVGFSDAIAIKFSSAANITMPALVAGTDYAVWCGKDLTVQATTNFTTPPQAGARRIGGFHYAPGGNAAAQAGGNTTPQINEYSFWDVKYRPVCQDPRGMTRVGRSIWSDIYLCGVDHHINGTSRYNVTIADGSSPPKRPLDFGGNGALTYADGNWWNFSEIAYANGKRLPTYAEFAALAYGTTEASSVGADPVSTVLNAAYTSKWGVVQSTGCLYTWGDEFGGGAAGAAWSANTQGRGSTYQMENALILGGYWDNASYSGSRCSYWYYAASNSGSDIGSRFVCDHLSLE